MMRLVRDWKTLGQIRFGGYLITGLALLLNRFHRLGLLN